MTMFEHVHPVWLTLGLETHNTLKCRWKSTRFTSVKMMYHQAVFGRSKEAAALSWMTSMRVFGRSGFAVEPLYMSFRWEDSHSNSGHNTWTCVNTWRNSVFLLHKDNLPISVHHEQFPAIFRQDFLSQANRAEAILRRHIESFDVELSRLGPVSPLLHVQFPHYCLLYHLNHSHGGSEIVVVAQVMKFHDMRTTIMSPSTGVILLWHVDFQDYKVNLTGTECRNNLPLASNNNINHFALKLFVSFMYHRRPTPYLGYLQARFVLIIMWECLCCIIWVHVFSCAWYIEYKIKFTNAVKGTN